MASLAVVMCAGTGYAHDFWLAPQDFSPESTGTQNVFVMVGHAADKTPWAVNAHRIIGLRSVGAMGITDHQSRVQAFPQLGYLPLNFQDAGTHVLMIETTNAFSELSADKFNAYVEEAGLTPVSRHRKQHDLMGIAGTEIYSRRGKAIINIGDIGDTDPDYVTQPLGLTLEIVPRENPARLNEDAALSATIYYRGRASDGIKVVLIRLDNDDGAMATRVSDAKGVVTFPRPPAGQWMLHAIWSDPLEDTRRADYDTIFSSLSFEITD